MKSNVNKEDIEGKKRYVFFSDPDVIARRAESTAAASQALQNFHIVQQRIDPNVSHSTSEITGNVQSKTDLKGLETLLSYHPVQPYPFTFITAVKRKLALSMHAEACKRAYEPENFNSIQTADLNTSNTNTNFKHGVNHMAQKMDFIKPLKIPDLKISPKTLDYSQRENFIGKEIVQPSASLSSKKFDALGLDDVLASSNKSPKGGEKAQRKLDFSLLEGSPMKSCDNVEQLKVPDSSISLNKKKEHARDSSREKENRSKRIKKDDSGLAKNEDHYNEIPRRSKTSRHLSRRDVDEVTDSIFEMFKSENFLSNAPRESDFMFRKPKSKNFVTSTVKKNEDRRRRSTSMQSTRSAQESSSENKIREYDDDSNSDKNIKMLDRITTRENYKPKSSETVESRNTIQNFAMSRPYEDRKYKNQEPSTSKQQEQLLKLLPQSQSKQFDSYSKSQMKKSHEKQKSSTSQSGSKISHSMLENSEDAKGISGSSLGSKDAISSSKIETISKMDDSVRTETRSQPLNKTEESLEVEQSGRNPQLFSQTERFHLNVDDSCRIENSSSHKMDAITNSQDGSTNEIETFASSKQSNSSPDYKSSQSQSFSIILDPTKISFRDESSEEQAEFCNLVTPDINLIPRFKRKKNLAHEQDNETDLKSLKQKPSNFQSKDDATQLLHPTALHMQFQAELNLLDTFNESLRQVTDVEKCLYNVKHDQEQDLLQKQRELEMKKQLILIQSGRDTIDNERYSIHQSRPLLGCTDNKNEFIQAATNSSGREKINEDSANMETLQQKCVNNPISNCVPDFERAKQPPNTKENNDYSTRKNNRASVQVTEVQTQTANDIATQTEIPRTRRRHNPQGRQISGITYQRGSSNITDIPQLSLESLDQFEDFDQIENISLPNRMHTMSEISLHETTSSIRTETGTEISISTRDVTCSFNKYLDSELAQLIKDEKQRYDEIEMLFKSREKTLNDRTKKLAKLEEQKRALRDMGQDSRISSVKKKQRALLLKLQQEKDEMNRLKELHKKASQERKLMLQKQRNMLNPQMSTKNILTKLKRSADSQSPRRLSGPMKGYDIRSPSSMSSLVDSDKSQLDRSHIETPSQTSEAKLHKCEGKTARTEFTPVIHEGRDIKSCKTDNYYNVTEPSDASQIESNKSEQAFETKQQKVLYKPDSKSRYEARSCKYKEKMPKPDCLYYASHGVDGEANIASKKSIKLDSLTGSDRSKLKENIKPTTSDMEKSITENIKSESDTLVDEFSKRSKSSQATEVHLEYPKPKKEKETLLQKHIFDTEKPNTDSDTIPEEISLKRSKSSQVTDDTFEASSKSSKKAQALPVVGKDSLSKKCSSNPKVKSSSKRKGSRSVKSKSSADVLSENILRSKSSSQISDEIMKHHNKRSKLEKNEFLSEENYDDSMPEGIDANESQSSLHALVKHSRAVKEKNYALLRNIANDHELKENLSRKDLENLRNVTRREEGNLPNVGNMSTRSQVSTLTISHHSSGESEKSYSRSVVIRAQDHHFRTSKKLEQILTAREAALTSRRNCVEGWIAWHSRLRAEESRVARMEEAAHKLVSATSNALSYHDTTGSSDTSDVESRIGVLAEKLAERRTEMARLKREAKRQAKQRLKALETNLLNQIKKYDSTIHEMRKKLESKRGEVLNDGSSEKLAIESKSLTDFKIPDIPIKRIKEIYNRNSDILKSRSDSELRTFISEKNQQDSDDVCISERATSSSNHKKSKSTIPEVTDLSEGSNFEKKVTTQSIQSIYEDSKVISSMQPDIISEDINIQSDSDKSEVHDYASRVKPLSDGSHNEVLSLSSKTKSSLNYNNIEQILSKLVESKVQQTKNIDQSQEADTISENLQIETSAEEVAAESVGTPLQTEHSNQGDNSIRESISEVILSEIRSELLEKNSLASDSNSQVDSSAYKVSKKQETIDDTTRGYKSTHGREKLLSSEDKSVRSEEKISSKVDSYDSFGSKNTTPDGRNGEKSKSVELTPKTISEVQSSGHIADFESSEARYAIDEEVNDEKSQSKSQSLTKKLSYLELGNKNLNDDISTLENDLKALSEMMSQFSKKSDSKLKTQVVSDIERNSTTIPTNDSPTSRDVSDEDYQNLDQKDVSVVNESLTGHSPSKMQTFEEQEIGMPSNHNATYIVNYSQDNHDQIEKDLTAQVTEIMLKIMPDTESRVPTTSHENDIKARSREILNEIEKSIISEHAKSPESTSRVTDIKTNECTPFSQNRESINDFNFPRSENGSGTENITEAIEAEYSEAHGEVVQNLEREFSAESRNISEGSEHWNKFESGEFEKKMNAADESLTPFMESQQYSSTPKATKVEDITDATIELPESSKGAMQTKMQGTDATSRDPIDLANLGRTNLTYELIRDPEYEDISEESMEVSEIMDRSESQRSDRFSQKSNRLPDKYEVQQKSEDVLRILDEITQTSSQAFAQQSEQLQARDDHRKKIDELLHRSQKLSENFEALIGKPDQAIRESTSDAVDISESSLNNFQLEEKEDKTVAASSDDKVNVAEKSIDANQSSTAQNTTDDLKSKPFIDEQESNIEIKSRATERQAEAVENATGFDERKQTAVAPQSDAIGTVELQSNNEKSSRTLQEELQDNTTLNTKYSPSKYDQVAEDLDDESRIVEVASESISEPSKDEQEDKASDKNVISDNTTSEVSKLEKISSNDPDIVSSESKDESQSLNQQLPESQKPDFTSETLKIGSDVFLEGSNEDLEQAKEFLAPVSSLEPITPEAGTLKIHVVENVEELSREVEALPQKSEDSSERTNESEQSDEVSRKTEDILQKYDVDLPSESSEDIDTPRSVSEIEMDSPRDTNDSRLEIEVLDDDLLENDGNFTSQNVESTTEFHAAPQIVSTSEKDIEAMIDKLKVSLEQPGLDVAELEAKLLRIQQLQIELEIKKLEAEEVSYYVREIPNKPPPPYTPPSGGRLPVSQTSPLPAPAVVPTNVDDLTSFTERATLLIYEAKQAGEDIANLEPPLEICQLSKDNNETVRRDRRIYNTFLFDLCKETISEVYHSEYEKPGPSWLKPNAKTKPTVKIPKTVEILNDYVSKEVATLFGFKTKLQRENLVMRWSRKRRDRVDELLAREAQAEEDEWTKFHHDELAVKNELTNMILDSLILDAANVVKIAYMKKRKVIS